MPSGHIGVTCCLCSQCVHNVSTGYMGPCPQCLAKGLKVGWDSGLGLKVREQRETKAQHEDEGRGTGCEMIDKTRAGTRTLDETRRERTLRGYEDVMPGTLRPGLTRRYERVRESKVVRGRRKRGERALLEDARR